MIGEHFLKSWSRTQASVTLSSAEAELVAMVKVTAELIGVLHMLRDWGDELRGRVYADSSAALAISNRRGSGKLRHIAIGLLWIQEKEKRDEVEFVKVEGRLNPADLMTKCLGRQRAEEHSRRLGQKEAEGRAKLGLELQRGGKEDKERDSGRLQKIQVAEKRPVPPVAGACEKGQSKVKFARGVGSGKTTCAKRDRATTGRRKGLAVEGQRCEKGKEGEREGHKER